MANARYQHSIQIPQELEDAWLRYCASQPEPESFNAFINRLMVEALDAIPQS